MLIIVRSSAKGEMAKWAAFRKESLKKEPSKRSSSLKSLDWKYVRINHHSRRFPTLTYMQTPSPLRDLHMSGQDEQGEKAQAPSAAENDDDEEQVDATEAAPRAEENQQTEHQSKSDGPRAQSAGGGDVPGRPGDEDGGVSGGDNRPKCDVPGRSGDEDGGVSGGDNRPKLPRPTGIQPCPRCDSKETKFCYYNNYNIKQPRYYCRTCQRYWTAGGTLRDVQPGAGRRKAKSARSQDDTISVGGAISAGSMPPLSLLPVVAPLLPVILPAVAAAAASVAAVNPYLTTMAMYAPSALPAPPPPHPAIESLSKLTSNGGLQSDPSIAAAAGGGGGGGGYASPTKGGTSVNHHQHAHNHRSTTDAAAAAAAAASDDGAVEGRRTKRKVVKKNSEKDEEGGGRAATTTRTMTTAAAAAAPAPAGVTSSEAMLPFAMQDWFAAQHSTQAAMQAQFQAAMASGYAAPPPFPLPAGMWPFGFGTAAFPPPPPAADGSGGAAAAGSLALPGVWPPHSHPSAAYPGALFGPFGAAPSHTTAAFNPTSAGHRERDVYGGGGSQQRGHNIAAPGAGMEAWPHPFPPVAHQWPPMMSMPFGMMPPMMPPPPPGFVMPPPPPPQAQAPGQMVLPSTGVTPAPPQPPPQNKNKNTTTKKQTPTRGSSA